MHKRKLSLMSFALAAIAFAFTMDAHAAALVANGALAHVDLGAQLVGAITQHGTGAGLGALGLAGMAIGSTADAQLAKSKLFRIAVEGATTDGRVIERTWIEQIAANYSRTKYGARVNLEHFRGVLPDGPFKAYGDVLAVEARELDGEFKGKLGLYAQIEPTADLVALTKASQKIYTSCEIDTSFADTKQAYLVGLAVTDSPASLGTEILSFAAQNPAASPFANRKQTPTNLFTAGHETTIEFEAEPETPTLPALLSGVKELLNVLGLAKKKPAAGADDTRFAEMADAVESLAKHAVEQAQASIDNEKRITDLAAQLGTANAQLVELTQAREADRMAFDELHTQLSTTGNAPSRPLSTGAAARVKTDC
jgi:hypothetical protein